MFIFPSLPTYLLLHHLGSPIHVWIVSNGARMQYARAFRWTRSVQMLKDLRQTRSNGNTVDGRTMAVFLRNRKTQIDQNFCIIQFLDEINGRCCLGWLVTCCATQNIVRVQNLWRITTITHWKRNDLLWAQCMQIGYATNKTASNECVADKCAYSCERY